METIKLDLIPGKKMPSLHASQYDDGRDYHIDLTENRAPYTLDGTETISLTVRKCDNTLVTMDIANTFADKSYIEFRTTEQMNACAGFNYGEIVLEDNGTRIGSLNFYLQVEEAPDEGGITSQSEINNLNRQIDDYLDETLPDVLDDDVPPIVERVIDETLAPVAKSGSYNDLENKPTIPATQVNSDWNANSGVSQILNKPNLSTVATSGDYNDLNNKPNVAVIDDTEASASKVYSSNKVESLVGNLSTIIKFGLNEIDTACTRWVNTRLQCTISNAKKGMVFRLKNPSSLALGMKISAVQKGDTDLSVWTQAPYELTQDYDNVYFQISTVNADKSISDEVMATVKIVVSNNCPIEIDMAKAKTEALIAPIDTTVVLNNYKNGDYFIVGDKLLKAIVDISAGTTLSVGTNCEVIQKGISNEVLKLYKTLYGFDKIEPAFTTLFDNPNLFAKGFYQMTNLICNANGKITSTNGTALIIPVEPSTTYTLLQDNDYLDTRLVLSNTTDDFEVNSTYNVLSNVNLDNHNKITIQTNADSKFICYCFTSRYDIDLNSIVFSIYKSNDLTITDKIKAKYIPVEATGNQLNGKNVLIFGDSIMQLPNTGTQRGKTAGDYFADVTGANVNVLAVGGTTLSRTVVNLPSDASTFENANACIQICSMIEFLVNGDFTTLDEALITLENAERLDSYTKDVTVPLLKTIDLNKVDVILISGGTNDCTSGRLLDDGDNDSLDPTNINGAINLIVKTILQNYPKIKLFFFTPIIRKYIYNDNNSWSDDYCPNAINKLLPDYAEQIEISAKANHIPSCDMYWKMGWNKYNFLSFCQGEDTTHPRNGGFKPMGEKMASFVKAHI